MAEAAEKKSRNPFRSMAKFFRELKSEMKKVVWPNRKQVINNTLIVLAVTVIIGAFIWILDAIFQYGLFQFITR
ncbi:MAG: preprotein translocase subunit SecE [Ruminococcaceae bacterium]|nr:preprotein translocase subunit SecE [Oscillospiraceae bacterium]